MLQIGSESEGFRIGIRLKKRKNNACVANTYHII
jgi:hypothetical protein